VRTERDRRALQAWFWSGAGLTFVILVIGGITRLTQSGLSMVDWRPIMGVIPPLDEAQWRAAFEQYRQYPEYQLLRAGMSLAEFQFIFFWEYLHRLAARLIGVVFLVPFVAFWLRGVLDRRLVWRSLLLLSLGVLQALMGWYMVMSGLVDVPYVSHYRLAAHLLLAFAIFGLCVWFALDLRPRVQLPPRHGPRARSVTGLWVIGGLLAVQVLWGAFVAGLKAGAVYPTFPLMGGALVPDGMMTLQPALLNLLDNPIAVQWTHRALGTLLALAVLIVHARAWASGVDRGSWRRGTAVVALVTVQYLLGVLTVLLHVPIALAVAHQATALALFGAWLGWLHHVRGLSRPVVPATPRSDGAGVGASQPATPA
jgi:heme a synthase